MPITQTKADRKFYVTMNGTRKKKERQYFDFIDAVTKSRLYGSFWEKN